jgi:hypothetical protein
MKMWLAAALLAVTAAPVFAAATVLTPTEIKATFGTGKPFTAASTTGSKTYSFTLNPDGTAMRTAKGSTAVTGGTWRVNEKGYCSKWGNGTESCYTIEKDGKSFTVRDTGGKSVSRWTLPRPKRARHSLELTHRRTVVPARKG